MNLKYLTKLKNQLVMAADFAPVMNYFMAEFGNQHAFMRKGKHVRNERLEAAITMLAKEVFPKAEALVIRGIRLIEIAEYDFTHGACFINGQLATLFWFSDVQMGLMAVLLPTTGMTQLVRFTGKEISSKCNFSEN